MAIQFNAAMQAYKNAEIIAKQASKTAAVQPNTIQQSNGGAFGSLIGGGIDSTVQALSNAEKISNKALVKQADITNVVTAISNAELTLQAVVAVRDRLVQAHQEIVRMPI